MLENKPDSSIMSNVFPIQKMELLRLDWELGHRLAYYYLLRCVQVFHV